MPDRKKTVFKISPIVILGFLIDRETIEFIQSLGFFILVDYRSIGIMASLYQQINTTTKVSTKVKKIR